MRMLWNLNFNILNWKRKFEASSSSINTIVPSQAHTIAINSPSAPISPPDTPHNNFEKNVDKKEEMLSNKNLTKKKKFLRVLIPPRESPKSILKLNKNQLSKSPQTNDTQTTPKEYLPFSPLGKPFFETFNDIARSMNVQESAVEEKKKNLLSMKSFPPSKIINKFLKSTKSPETPRRIFDISDPTTFISSYTPPSNASIASKRNSFRRYFSPSEKGKKIQKQMNTMPSNNANELRTFSQSDINEIVKALTSPRPQANNYLNKSDIPSSSNGNLLSEYSNIFDKNSDNFELPEGSIATNYSTPKLASPTNGHYNASEDSQSFVESETSSEKFEIDLKKSEKIKGQNLEIFENESIENIELEIYSDFNGENSQNYLNSEITEIEELNDEPLENIYENILTEAKTVENKLCHTNSNGNLVCEWNPHRNFSEGSTSKSIDNLTSTNTKKRHKTLQQLFNEDN